MGATCNCISHEIRESECSMKRSIQPDPVLVSEYYKHENTMNSQVRELYQQLARKPEREITEINITNSLLSEKDCKLFALLFSELGKLETLKFSQNQMPERGAFRIANELSRLSLLRCLVFEGNLIGDNGFTALSTVFPFLDNLSELVVVSAGLTRKGLFEFCSSMEKIRALRTIRLNGNNIGRRGTRMILEKAKIHGRINELCIDNVLDEGELESYKGEIPQTRIIL